MSLAYGLAAMVIGNQVNNVSPIGENHVGEGTIITMNASHEWSRQLSNASSEGERLVLEALVESSRGGRRTVLQYIKMLSVIALPVAAVICLVSYTLHNSRIERASQLAAVQQFQIFADIEALVTSMRAERGYTTSVVILGGQDAAANEEMFKQRSRTDYILLSLPVWPDGLAINNVQLTTRAHLGDMLNALRGRVSTLSVDFHGKWSYMGRGPSPGDQRTRMEELDCPIHRTLFTMKWYQI